MFRRTHLVWLAALFLIGSNAPVRADFVRIVTLDTSALASNAGSFGPYTLDFQFNDGSSTGDANNHVTISNVTFGGGSTVGSLTDPIGNSDYTGNLGNSLTIYDGNSGASGFNEVQQKFDAGSTLRFQIDVTTTGNESPADEFSFTIYDVNGNNVVPPPPASPNAPGAFLLIDVTGSNPTVTPSPGGINNTPISAPVLTPLAAVPEPSTLVLLLTGAAFAGAASVRRKFAARKQCAAE